MTSRERNILNTLAYFDIFDYPLTATEIWKWLYIEESRQSTGSSLQSVNIVDIQQVFSESDYLKQRVESKDGFYFLKGREELVAVRRRRYSLAERKFHKARRVIRILRWVPFVKMIGVCNTLAYNNSRQQADIDLFVITKRRRVWQVRFWVVSFLKLFRLRPSPAKSQDTICSTFFIDENNLNVKPLAISEDIYLPYWIKQLVPVYDEGVYKKFIAANTWVLEKLPNSLPVMPPSRRCLPKAGWFKKVVTLFCFFLPESMFKKYQKRIMPERLRKMANQDSRVVVTDYMLKFHDNDRRQYFLNEWRKRTATLA